MRKLILGLWATGSLAWSESIPFDLGPDGMNSTNEVPAVTTPSTGTGGTIESGIWFDTATSNLSFVIGYGSSAGFADLTGAATAAHIHGPADTAHAAGVLVSLAPYHFLNTDPAKGGILRGVVQFDTPERVEALLQGLNYINVHTAANAEGEIRGQLIPRLNQAPTIVCPAPVEAECTGRPGTETPLGVKVSDPEGDALTVIWSVDGSAYQTNSVPAGAPGTETEVGFSAAYGLGAHDVVVRVSDGKLEATCTTQVTIVDRTSPVIRRVVANPAMLWPPNHRMVPVKIQVQADDCSRVKSKIVSVSSNEPVNGRGDGNTAPDWQITGDLTVKLRAERSGRGNDRIYTITVEASDGINPPTQGTVEVKVPHNLGPSR
jgi:hypothetical protein